MLPVGKVPVRLPMWATASLCAACRCLVLPLLPFFLVWLTLLPLMPRRLWTLTALLSLLVLLQSATVSLCAACLCLVFPPLACSLLAVQSPLALCLPPSPLLSRGPA